MTTSTNKCQATRVTHTHTVMPEDTNPFHNLFGGQLMEFMNNSGYASFKRHTRQEGTTVSMDNLNFLEPIPMGHIIRIETFVSGVGKRSVEVFGKVIGTNIVEGGTYLAATAFMTFAVTSEDTSLSYIASSQDSGVVKGIVPETAEEKFVCRDYAARRTERLKILADDQAFIKHLAEA